MRDPYFTLRLYTGGNPETYDTRSAATQDNLPPKAYHWYNAEFNSITDEVFATAIDDVATLEELWTDAMEIWLDELPDVQVLEFYHRIPMNTTYWTNWPTHDNPYVNGAFWHLTFQLILNELEPVQ